MNHDHEFREFQGLAVDTAPVKCVQHYHTYIMVCQCPAKTVSVILGDGVGIACPACGVIPAAQIVDGRLKIGHKSPEGSIALVN